MVWARDKLPLVEIMESATPSERIWLWKGFIAGVMTGEMETHQHAELETILIHGRAVMRDGLLSSEQLSTAGKELKAMAITHIQENQERKEQN